MTTIPASPGGPRTRRDRALPILAGLLIAGFVIAFGARPTTILAFADLDDGLFMQLGLNLASGKWLGHYNEKTLVKGIGFPLFLAINNLIGLPFPLAIALLHAACASFAAAVVRRLTRSLATGVALLAALLLAPIIYNGGFLGVAREFFYMSLTLAFVSSTVALVTGCLATNSTGDRRWLAPLTGVLGAWVWLTREEGVWLFPFIGLALLVPWLAPARAAASPGLRARLSRLAPAGRATAVAVALVVLVGLINWAVYGRFVVNEIKDRAFQGAMTALQDASAPYHKTGVPVPAAARARIYAVSPAFAELKEPLLDGPLQHDVTQWGCLENPKFCNDFGGGWFFWALRASAAAHGEHESATKAAAFYRTLARQVRQGCADGRLKCEHWPAPLVPPMKAYELGDVARSFGRELSVLTFSQPVAAAPRPSGAASAKGDAYKALLNNPATQPATTQRRMSGWFVGAGPQWFRLQVQDPVQIAKFTRSESPDLVAYFKNPALQQQRFDIEAACPPEGACPATLVIEGDRAYPVDLAALGTGGHAFGKANLYLDSVGAQASSWTLKMRFSRAWLRGAATLNPVFRGLVVLGGLAWLALLAQAIVRRRVGAALLLCTGLLGAVLARAVILSLIDALSFAAASSTYSLAAIPLLLIFSVLALHEAIAWALSRRGAA